MIYAAELLSPAGPNIGGIFNQFIGNVGAALAAPGDQNLFDTGQKYPDGSPLEISVNTNNTEEVGLLGTKFVTTFFIGSAALIPLVNLANQLSTPLLGALLGFAGPGLSVLAQTMDSVKIISTALMALDFITTGGLLGPGWALGGAPGTPEDEPPVFSGWGGTAWDAVSADIPGVAGFEGLPVGAIATGYGLKNAIAQAIRLPGGPKSAQAAAPAAAQVAPAVADESAAVQAAVVSDIGPAAAPSAPVEEAPVEEAPVEEAPVEEAPVEEAPVEVSAPVSAGNSARAEAGDSADDSDDNGSGGGHTRSARGGRG